MLLNRRVNSKVDIDVHIVLSLNISTMQNLSEIRIVTIASKVSKRLANKGVMHIFVSCNNNHSKDYCKMQSKHINACYLDCDITFLY